MTLELTVVGDQLWKRIGESMDRVEQRLRKTIEILETTGIPFAIVGGNAVRIWVAQVDPGAVRYAIRVVLANHMIKQDDYEANPRC